MPVFKVSEDLQKLSKELLRIQITVLGDCPQCGGSQYRSGVCEDCAYISPEVQEAIQSWQLSQGLSPEQAQRMQMQQEQARQSLQMGTPLGTNQSSVVKAVVTVVDAFPQLAAAKRKKDSDECPRCQRKGFDLECEGCGYEEPPNDLNVPRPQFTGPSPDLLKTRRINFLPSSDSFHTKVEKKKNETKKKTKEKSKKAARDQQKTPTPPNLDNVNTVRTDPKPRMDDAVAQLALSDFYNGSNPDTSEELQ